MGDHQQAAGAFLDQFEQQFQHRFAAGFVEAAGGFVGQHQRGARGQCAADCQALLAPGVHHGIRAVSLTILAYHHLMNARLETSIRYAVQGKALLSQSGHSFFESYADLIIALCNRYAGRASSARKDVYSDYQRTPKASPAWVNRATAMVVVLYEQNQLDEAQQLCDELMAMVNSSSATEAIATVYITLSRLLHRRQQHARASRLLDQLSCIQQLGNYARFVSQVAQESMRQAWLGGKAAELHSGHDMPMNGMISGAQFEELRNSVDDKFDSLFVKYMIAHHEGAIQMTQGILESENIIVKKFGEKVVKDQSAEIAELKKIQG